MPRIFPAYPFRKISPFCPIFLNTLLLICLLHHIGSVMTLQEPPFNYMLLDLQRNSTDFINQTDYWAYQVLSVNTTPKYSICAGTYLLKGYNTNYPRIFAERNYGSLPPHKSVFMTITFWLIDRWRSSSSYFEVYISKGSSYYFDQIVGQADYSQASWGRQLCGDSSYYDLAPVIISANTNHNDANLVLGIYQYRTDTAQLGVRDIKILFSNSTLASSSHCGITHPTNLLLSQYNCPCDVGQYKNSSTNTCTSCHSTCATCSGQYATNCLSCATGYSYNGTQCILCDTTCETCFGSAANQCFTCHEGYHLNWDNTCIQNCSAPFIKNQTAGNHFCNTPCDSSYFYYTNGSCLPTCSGAFSQLTIRSQRICNFYCETGSYLYTNGSCLPDCGFPYQAVNRGGYLYCSYPCSSSEYEYWNGSCLSSCPPPLTQAVVQNYTICNYTCRSSEYLVYNGSCISSCPSPFKQRVEAEKLFCDSPCPSSSSYFGLGGTCSSSCPSSQHFRVDGGLKICQTICEDPKPYYNLDNKNCKALCLQPYIVIQTEHGQTCYLPISEAETKEATRLAVFTNVSSSLVTAGLLLTAVICPFDSSAITGSALSRLLEYTKYLNISHSVRLEAIFSASDGNPLLFNIAALKLPAQTQEELAYSSNILVFTRYGLGSSFLLNFCDDIIWLLCLLGVLMLFYLLERVIKRFTKRDQLQFITEKARMIGQNYFTDQIYDGCSSIIFFFGLELWSSDFQYRIRRVSIIVAVICVSIILYQLRFHYKLIRKYQKIKSRCTQPAALEEGLRTFEEKNEGVKVLYEDFKDNTFARQAFLLLLTMRGMIYSLLVTTIYSHPFLQISLMTCLNVLFLGYVVIKRPFKFIELNIKQSMLEAVLLTANISLFITALLDKSGASTTLSIQRTSEVIIM